MNFEIGDEVAIVSPAHRMDDRVGTVTGTPDASFWGFYSVQFPNDDTGNYSFLPSELRPVTKDA